MGQSKTEDLHATPRCFPHEPYDFFEGWERSVRLALKLGEIVLEPESLPEAWVEGEDYDGSSADDAPHLREGDPRIGEVVQGKHTGGALRMTVSQRQPLGSRGYLTEAEDLLRLPPHGRRRLDGHDAVAQPGQGEGIVAGPGTDVDDLTTFRQLEQPG